MLGSTTLLNSPLLISVLAMMYKDNGFPLENQSILLWSRTPLFSPRSPVDLQLHHTFTHHRKKDLQEITFLFRGSAFLRISFTSVLVHSPDHRYNGFTNTNQEGRALRCWQHRLVVSRLPRTDSGIPLPPGGPC